MSWKVWTLWLRVPWSDTATAAALIVATAAPVLLTTSADVWQSAASDDVARRAVAEATPQGSGVDLTVEVAFDAGTMADADAEITVALGEIDGLTDPLRSLSTLPGLVTVGDPVRAVGPSGRLYAHEGALDAVTVVDRLADTGGGVWITTWFAEQHGVTLDDEIGLDAGAGASGTGRRFRVVGLYQPLWTAPDAPAPDLDEFWTTTAAPGVLPRYIPAFGGPNSELILTEATTLLDSNLTGVARWRAGFDSTPESLDELLGRRDDLRGFEADLVGDTPLADAVGAATSDGRRPQLQTDLFDTAAAATASTARLERPMASVRSVGLVVGMFVVGLAGWFVVDRRRSEYRLLCREGRGTFDLSSRSAAQFAAPVAIGTSVGVVAAVLGTWWFGPSTRFDVGAVSWSSVATVAGASLATVAVSTGAIGARTLHTERPLDTRRLAAGMAVVLVAATAFLWAQIGATETQGTTSVDLTVVALPIVALLLATLVTVAAVAVVLGRIGPLAAAWPDVAYLAVRRFATGATGVASVAAAVGLGVGLVVFASALSSTLARTVDVKLATEIGAESSVELTGRLPVGVELPPGSTVVATFDTVVVPGDVRMRVVAVDARTFADAVTWPDEFGSDPRRVLAALAGPIDGTVPVVAVGEAPPAGGAFGFTRTSAIRVVDRVDAAPLAGVLPLTILVDGERLDRFALDDAGFDTAEDAAAAGFLLPTDRFRHRVLSQAPVDDVVRALEDADVVVRSTVSTAERRDASDLVAARAAFGYLGVLGVVAAGVALAALALFLASRRRNRAVSHAMTRSMGVSARRAAAVTAVEVALVMSVAVVTALAAVPIVTRRLSGRFDPRPGLPPDVPADVDWLATGGVATVAVVSIVGAVWVVERRLASRPIAEVLRDAR